jgi:hypothetical protein
MSLVGRSTLLHAEPRAWLSVVTLKFACPVAGHTLALAGLFCFRLAGLILSVNVRFGAVEIDAVRAGQLLSLSRTDKLHQRGGGQHRR